MHWLKYVLNSMPEKVETRANCYKRMCMVFKCRRRKVCAYELKTILQPTKNGYGRCDKVTF
ncbi:hypothetical protein NBRC116591_20790 [Sessilibacter corallicola]|uniref:Uncharacterized protein n=1 Tax=Sessilibacter corallicola TaxID=2904075 RepID=A0ABQ0A9E6_9GAMM